MKQYPILMRPEMVRELLAGIKHQTRRTWEPKWGPGDLLWVREHMRQQGKYAMYVADGTVVKKPWWYSKTFCPSMHMPRRFARITLRVTRVSAVRSGRRKVWVTEFIIENGRDNDD